MPIEMYERHCAGSSRHPAGLSKVVSGNLSIFLPFTIQDQERLKVSLPFQVHSEETCRKYMHSANRRT
jgi:hypothetical protein